MHSYTALSHLQLGVKVSTYTTKPLVMNVATGDTVRLKEDIDYGPCLVLYVFRMRTARHHTTIYCRPLNKSVMVITSNSKVAEILSHGNVKTPTPPPLNMFAYFRKSYEIAIKFGPGRTMTGHPNELISFVLGGMRGTHLDSRLDEWHANQLFKRQRPGLINSEPVSGRVTVRTKPFKKWVKRNARVLLMPSKRSQLWW